MTNIPFQADSFVQFPTGRVNLEDIRDNALRTRLRQRR